MVGNCDLQPATRCRPRLHQHGFIGVLEGVSDQICQDLRQVGWLTLGGRQPVGQADLDRQCAFGVLTVDTLEQALARTGGDTRDTGRHAAEVALRMAALRAELHG